MTLKRFSFANVFPCAAAARELAEGWLPLSGSADSCAMLVVARAILSDAIEKVMEAPPPGRDMAAVRDRLLALEKADATAAQSDLGLATALLNVTDERCAWSATSWPAVLGRALVAGQRAALRESAI